MKRTTLSICGIVVTIGAGWVVAQETLPGTAKEQSIAEPTLADHYSYAIGLEMGMSFRTRETELSIESLMNGVQDGLRGAAPKYDQATCGRALQQLDALLNKKAMAQQHAAGAANRKAGAAFLAKNKMLEGVQVTKSGLQYKVIKPGTGATPKLSDTVSCNYRGTLIDGREFDASANHGGPATFPVQGVIPGWTEALQLMKVGAKWQLFIPADLAYGDDQRGPLITPGSTLVFDIELVGIEGQ